MKLFKQFFEIKNNERHKIIKLFGIKFKIKRNQTIPLDVFKMYHNYNYWNNFAKIYHKRVFKKYEGIHRGQSVVLFACGPTAKFYEKINKAVHVGINYSFLDNPVALDYLMIHDSIVAQTHFEELKAYEAKKFYGYHTNPINAKEFNADTKTVNELNATRFFISDPAIHTLDNNTPDVINPDITNGLFFDRGGGTVFSTLQFILYTQPSKIYLVGCDCTEIGHFNMLENEHSYLLPKTQHLWEEFKYVKDVLYPELEIISVNPVGLKGLFKDVYTKSYVDAHPELLDENIEIIKEENIHA